MEKLFFYKSERVPELDIKEAMALIVHEAWHVALGHTTNTLVNRDKNTWNRACDYLINGMMDNSGWKLPEGGCLDHKYDNWPELDIYNDLLQNSPSDLIIRVTLYRVKEMQMETPYPLPKKNYKPKWLK